MAARHSKKHGRHKARHAVPSSKPAIIKSMFVPKDRFYTAVMQGVHDSMERERKRTRQAMHTVVAALAIIVLIGSICFGWMGARASLRTHELVRVSTCQQAVIDMNNSYFKASQLKTQVDSAFTSMDANYNLDQLSNLYGEKVDIPSTLQCSNNPSNTADTATKAKAAYDKTGNGISRCVEENAIARPISPSANFRQSDRSKQRGEDHWRPYAEPTRRKTRSRWVRCDATRYWKMTVRNAPRGKRWPHQPVQAEKRRLRGESDRSP